jgi:hypothetical protein
MYSSQSHREADSAVPRSTRWRVDSNQARPQARAQARVPAIPKKSPVAIPVLDISPQTAGTPCGPLGTWSKHVSQALSVASMYPPEKARGISRLKTINRSLLIDSTPSRRRCRAVAQTYPKSPKVRSLEVPGGAFCIRKWLMSADRSLARSLCVQVPGTSQFQYRRRF